MSQHLNRLNAKEAAEWDIAYKRFCETGTREESGMKAFEKWSKTPNGYAERESDYAEGEAAWRAALEEVLKQANLPSSVDKVDIMNWIEKELGEDDET